MHIFEVKINWLVSPDFSRSIALPLNTGPSTPCRSRSMQCHFPVQTFSPILSYIVTLFILDTSLMIRSILKSNFKMILILKTHLAIRIHAAVTLLHSVVIRFVNIDQIWSRSICSLSISINSNEMFYFVNLSIFQVLRLCD